MEEKETSENKTTTVATDSGLYEKKNELSLIKADR